MSGNQLQHPPQRQPSTSQMPARLGNVLWATLHSFADTYPLSPSSADQYMADRFLANFRDQLMTLNGAQCACRRVFALLLQLWPPNLAEPGALREWAQAVHEFVNLKLGKPRFIPELKHPILTLRIWKQILPNHPPPPFLT